MSIVLSNTTSLWCGTQHLPPFPHTPSYFLWDCELHLFNDCSYHTDTHVHLVCVLLLPQQKWRRLCFLGIRVREYHLNTLLRCGIGTVWIWACRSFMVSSPCQRHDIVHIHQAAINRKVLNSLVFDMLICFTALMFLTWISLLTEWSILKTNIQSSF